MQISGRLPGRLPGWVLLLTLLLSALVIACGGQTIPTDTTAAPTPLSAPPDTVAPEPEATASPAPAAPAATEAAPTATTAPAAATPAPEAAATTAAPEPAPPATPVEVMTPPDPEDVLTIALNELNDSGQSGFATLTGKGEQTEMVLNISAGALETELVHIHSGQCGDNLGGVVHPLTSFADGAGVSVTTVDATLNSLRNGDFAVNSHKKGEPPVYTTCGNIPTTAESVTIALNELNDSGQSGFATLTGRGEQTEVVLNISAGTLETELVHIHSGQCGDNLGGVVHPLTSFADGAGASVTMVEATLDSLRNGDFAVNSHKKGEPPVYTTCGNIPGAEPVAMAPDQEAPVVTLSNFRFAPDVLEVRAGEKAQFTVTSVAGRHTFTVQALGVDVVVSAGTTRTVEFDVPDSAPGELELVCRFHSSGGTGMVAKISVVGSGDGY